MRPEPVVRGVAAGGLTKAELLEQLCAHGVELNDAARALFADDRFAPAPDRARVDTGELSVAALGFADGATIAEILGRAAVLGLSPCPLELAAHLRLALLDQPEGAAGHPPTRHRAPPGSITVVSLPLDADDGTPKGFYLRRIDGVLWLRGYRSGAEHVWSPEDRLLFRRL